MAKKMRKILCLTLLVAMLASIAACGTGGGGSTAATTTAATTAAPAATTAAAAEPAAETTAAAAEAEATTAAPAATTAAATTAAAAPEPAAPGEPVDIMQPRTPYPEKITVNTCRVLDTNPHFLDGDDIESNPMTRWINEQLNIDYKVVWQVESNEYGNKLSLNIAAGDLPDMIPMRTTEYLIFRSLVDNEMAADMGEAYEKCAGDYMIDTYKSYNFANLEPFTIDGVLRAISGGQYAYEHELVWMRKDWMDICGLELPKTLDDIANIVTTFQAMKPAGEDVIGIPVTYNYAVNAYNSSFELSSVLYNSGGAPKTWVRGDDGEVIYGSLLPGMKDGLAVLADWYQRGIIDKQFVTRTASGSVEALVSSGQVGLWFGPWWNGYQINDLIFNNPDAEVICTSAPVGANGKYRHSWPAAAGDYVVMSAKYAHPEVLMKILNLEYDMHRGFNQEAFEIWKPSLDNNVSWTTAFPTQGINLEYMDAVPRSGQIAKSIVDTGELAPGLQGTEDMMRWAWSAKSYADTGVVDGSNWLDYVCRYIGANITMDPIDEPVKPVFSYFTESMPDLWPNLEKLESEMYFGIIMGEKPVDYFDEFVAAWKAQGGDKLTAEIKALVD